MKFYIIGVAGFYQNSSSPEVIATLSLSGVKVMNCPLSAGTKNGMFTKASDRPLYFLHIPWVAGSKFFHLLDQQFRSEEICSTNLYHDRIEISKSQLTSYRYFRGHL